MMLESLRVRFQGRITLSQLLYSLVSSNSSSTRTLESAPVVIIVPEQLTTYQTLER